MVWRNQPFEDRFDPRLLSAPPLCQELGSCTACSWNCSTIIIYTSFSLDRTHLISQSIRMTTQFEASLRTGAVLARTSPFPNDPPAAVTLSRLGISTYLLGLALAPERASGVAPETASGLEVLHAKAVHRQSFTQAYTLSYTNLHTHLHRFTHNLHEIYTPHFHTTISGPIVYLKTAPLPPGGMFPPPVSRFGETRTPRAALGPRVWLAPESPRR